ncbi:uncharacterized protein LOC129948290 [Eupeodes corollae]|uniref:uncharacterized protein LOC129948290 n=1 Tax=Eupeodes corollae TaxID=290404 RepID=UPI0024919151|nr:uncharacterized protein LOC129948290 [Eupeodes corollae]
MDKLQSKTLKMIYNNQLKLVDCPKNAKYDECIEIALELFNIAPRFKEFIQISNDCGQIFEKHTFEYYNLIFPNPEIIFFIKIDYEKFKKQQKKKQRKPFSEISIKRKRFDENEKVSIRNNNNYFREESLYEVLSNKSSEEPATKKRKISGSKSKKTWWHLLLNKLFD